MSDSTERMFHLVDAAGPRPFDGSPWKPPGFDGEGFVHLSFAHQLDGTLLAHFKQSDAIELFEMIPAQMGDALKLEPSRSGALFPHCYRPLERSDVARWWTVNKVGDRWELPSWGETADTDQPNGRTDWAERDGS